MKQAYAIKEAFIEYEAQRMRYFSRLDTRRAASSYDKDHQDALADLEKMLVEKNRALNEKNQALNEKNRALKVVEQERAEKEQALNALEQSRLREEQSRLREEHLLRMLKERGEDPDPSK